MSDSSKIAKVFGIAPGARVTVDVVTDDPRDYEVVIVDGSDVVIRDTDSGDFFKVPISKVAVVDLSPSFSYSDLSRFRISLEDVENIKSKDRVENKQNKMTVGSFLKSAMLRTYIRRQKYASIFSGDSQ